MTSYDDRQLDKVLRVCPSCGVARWTARDGVCIPCERSAA